MIFKKTVYYPELIRTLSSQEAMDYEFTLVGFFIIIIIIIFFFYIFAI